MFYFAFFSGGIITESDLANFTAVVKVPLQFQLHDNNLVFSTPLPSSGAVYLFILNVLDGMSYVFHVDTNIDPLCKALIHRDC